jgi:hypothetical protein
MQITICGGGNAAHTLAGLLGSQPDLSVHIYAPYGDETQRWQRGLQKNSGLIVNTPNGEILGQPAAVYRDPALAVTGSQLVLLALPAFAHEPVLKQIAQFISPGAWLGALPARGGFDLCAGDILKERKGEITLFGFQTLPWACRIQEYGQKVSILGTKALVDLAAWPSKMAPVISSVLGDLLGVELHPIPSFLALTLADTGQLIHPGIMYGLFHNWDGVMYEKHRLFYQSVDEEIAGILQQMSREVGELRLALERDYPGLDLSAVRSVGDWLRRAYSKTIEDSSTLQSCFATNRSYTGLLAPMYESEKGFAPDFQSRYLSEDVPYGLLVTRGIAELAGIATPMIDRVLVWAQERLQRKYLVDSMLKGADLNLTRSPQRYGYKSLEQLMVDMQYLPPLEEYDSTHTGGDG